MYFFMNIIINCFSLILPLLSGKLVDILVYSKNIKLVVNFCIIYIIIKIISLILGYFSSIMYIKLQTNTSFEINLSVVEHLKKVSIKNIYNKDTVYLTRIINNDVNIITLYYINTMNKVIVNIFLFIFGLIMLFKINYILSILIIIINSVYFFIYKLLKLKLYVKNYELQELQSNFFSKLNDQLKFIKFLKIHSCNNILKIKLKESFNNLIIKAIEVQRVSFSYESCNQIINLIQLISIFLIGGFSVINNKITIGEYTIIYSYFSLITNASKYFFDLGKSYQESLASYNRINDIFLLDKQLTGEKKIKTISKIEINNLCFNYNEKKIFNDLNLIFEKGNIYSITGENGSGKSTFVLLILGLFINDYLGSIKYNDINIEELDMYETLLNNIGVVEQEPILLNDTLKNNLILDRKLDKFDLDYFINMMDLNKYILSLENGLETIINEKSNNISGGEKQKISIIRQLIKNPDVLIFDEPTSALDKNSCETFINYIRKIKKDKIIIIITHSDRIKSISDFIINLCNE